jgi:hypothetical protein
MERHADIRHIHHRCPVVAEGQTKFESEKTTKTNVATLSPQWPSAVYLYLLILQILTYLVNYNVMRLCLSY